MARPRVAVIICSIRPNRFGDKPAKWMLDHARARTDLEVELVDLAEFRLPLFDAVASDLWVPTQEPEAIRWQQKLAGFDGFIFVTPEYNHSMPGALKNAIDWAYKPFTRKAVAYVGYGSVGGSRAVEHLRGVMAELQVASVRNAVHIGGHEFASLAMGRRTWDDVKSSFDSMVPELLNNLVWWVNATKAARELATRAVAA